MTEYEGRWVRWVDRAGYAVVGDIIIGETAEVLGEKTRQSTVIAGDRFRWPNNTIPYTINVPSTAVATVESAILEWNNRSPYRLVPRTNEGDYVDFVRQDTGCYAFVGRRGGRQIVNLDAGCGLGAAIHEIGHCVGLWHTQSRQDRDSHVIVEYANIDKSRASQYDVAFDDGLDVGPYDYGSIMHYSSLGFNSNPGPAIRSIPEGISFGQRGNLSPGDLDAAYRLSGTTATAPITVDTFPTGLRLIVDGQEVITPRTFDWAEGSSHQLQVPDGAQFSANTLFRYRFARWSDNATATHAITVKRSETTYYAANFFTDYRFPVSWTTGGRVEIEPASPDGYYTVTTPVTLRAIPDAGFQFVSWDRSGTGFLTTLGYANNPHTLPQLVGSHSLRAVFAQGPVTRVEANQRGARVRIDGVDWTLPAAFSWVPGSTHTLEAPASVSDQVQINGVDVLGFQNWDGQAMRTRTVTAGGENTTIRAEFSRTVSLLASRSGSGSVFVSPFRNGQYPAGTQVTLTAQTTLSNVVFGGWTGDVGGDTNPLVLTMDNQTYVVGRFAVRQQLLSSAIVNAASYAPGVAPGQMVTLFGVDIGPADPAFAATGSDGRLLTEINGTRVTFDGVPAPIIYLSSGQISVVVPYAVAPKAALGQSAQVQIVSPGRDVNTVFVPIRTAAPGIFTRNSSGSGNCACLNQNGTVNGPLSPAVPGSAVVLFATGEGQTVPAGEDGKIAVAPLPRPALPVRAILGGREVPVEYAGGAPGLAAGVLQVNIRIPLDQTTGEFPIQLIVGDQPGVNTATVAVRR
jgi:uncharacterized protein (TIGR03437 family)